MNISMKSTSLSFFTSPVGTAGMLKSTKEKLERQQNMQTKVAFFDAQKDNLKSMQCENLEDIARKLEMFHSYEEQIAAAKQEYNNSQMWHVMDEAQERGEQIAKAAEKCEPKTEEERKEETAEEALGTEEEKGALTEMMEELSELAEYVVEQPEGTIQLDDTIEQLEDTTKSSETEVVAMPEDSLEMEEYLKEKYIRIDVRV